KEVKQLFSTPQQKISAMHGKLGTQRKRQVAHTLAIERYGTVADELARHLVGLRQTTANQRFDDSRAGRIKRSAGQAVELELFAIRLGQARHISAEQGLRYTDSRGQAFLAMHQPRNFARQYFLRLRLAA